MWYAKWLLASMHYVIVKERHETIMGYKPRERVARSARVVYSHNR